MLKKSFYKVVAKYGLGRPEMAELLESRYGDISSFSRTAINRLCYLIRYVRLFSVTTVTLELSTYCNLKCTICPVNRDMNREKGYMSFELVKKILIENTGLAFVLLYHWGESFMHPDLFPIIHYVKSRRIKAFLTTNGTLFNGENIKSILESGLDRLTISMDGTGVYYERIRGFPYAKLEENIFHLIEERNRCRSSLKVDLDMTVTEDNEADVKNFRKKWESIVDMLRIHPFVYVGGNAGTSLKKRCNEIWRGNLIVLWDGRVVPCCVDYEGELVLGNVRCNTLKEIINNQAAISLRKALLSGKFPAVCRGCEEYKTKVVNPRFF